MIDRIILILLSWITTFFAPQIILGQILDSVSFGGRDSISISPDSLYKLSPNTTYIDSYKKSDEKVVREDEKNNSELWYVKYGGEAILALIVAAISFIVSQTYFRLSDKKKKKEEYCGLLKIILEEVKRNLDLECQLHAYFYVGIMPTFGLSFFVSDNVFKEFTKVSENYDLLKLLFHKYFEYRHIQNRIDRTKLKSEQVDQLLLQKRDSIYPDELRLAINIYEVERDGTHELIRGNIRGSLDLYNAIVKEINKFEKSHAYSTLPLSYLDQKYDEFQKNRDVIGTADQSNINLNDRKRLY